MLGRSRTLKSARLRGKRRKMIIGKTVIIFVLVVVFWILAFWMSGMPQFTVNNIFVEGNSSVSSAEIEGVAKELLSGRYYLTVSKSNVLFYPRKAIEEKVFKSYPQIESVSVHLQGLNSIGVSVSERQPRALWCDEASDDAHSSKVVISEMVINGKPDCFVFDKTGLIFASSTELASSSVGFIKFFKVLPHQSPIGQYFLSADRIKELFEFAKNISSVGFEVLEFRERANGVTEAVLAGGERLIFTADTDLKSAIANLQAILGDQSLDISVAFDRLDYIDLRFGNRVYYKLKSL